MDLVFVPGRFLGIALQECFVSLDGFHILLLTGFQVTFLGELGSTRMVELRDVKHSGTDCTFSVLHRFRILLVLLVPRRIAVITLHNNITMLLGFVELLLHDEDFNHGDIGERSVDVVRVDLHQALEGLHGFFVTVMVLVLHTDTIVHGILERDLLVLQESFSFLDTTTFQVREGGSHEVHSFCAQVVRIFTLVGADDVIVVLDSSRFVFGNVIVRFSQVVHGEGRFLTREVLEAGHLLVGANSVAELAVHEVVFSHTEPSLRHEAVVREALDETFTEAEGLVVFAASFEHGGSLVHHDRRLVFLRVLVDVFEEVTERLGVLGLRKLVNVRALGRLVIAVGAPCHVFFVLALGIEEELLFQLELVVTQLLESRSATLILLTLTVVHLLFPLGNSLTHALFIKATGTASLVGLVLENLVRTGALLEFRAALLVGFALCRQLLGFGDFVFTGVGCSKRVSD